MTDQRGENKKGGGPDGRRIRRRVYISDLLLASVRFRVSPGSLMKISTISQM